MFHLVLTVGTDLILGVILGGVGGLFGIGGGLIAIPVLGLMYGMNQQVAQGTALVMIVPNVMIGFWRYRQHNDIDLRAAAIMALSAVISTYIAARFAVGLDAQRLRSAFAVFLIVLGCYFLWGLVRRERERAPERPMQWRYLPVIGMAGGACSGLFSVGAGVVAAPALVTVFGLRQTTAQGLALATVVPGALVALITYTSAGRVDWPVGIPLALGGLVSVSWGVNLAHRLPERRLRALFCAVLFCTALLMI